MRLTSAIFAASLAVSALAAPAPGLGIANFQTTYCGNGGQTVCCNKLEQVTSLDTGVGKILGLLNVSLSQVTGLVGLQCTSINALGLGGAVSCTQQTACCSNNSYNGVVAIGCVPINISI
ncbi:hypothetical protein CC1G_04893 [Coprinopsis cinerea okayama7|uniref:Hydrophobin n=1 Tax=Coprinopsis cinerea (strain Okayama-7 / 130 / ATCC MYA-4618 / FGSC 9003) TaxID=240176 RepID=A8PFE7_COPC7|nr:hypothetical protein CC1G_04893 [Coprinopsis cinerea okayama7\|eukprot:XP_001841049.1 hypothetical protein CC1G_04893 [Coprinopsis cinerea okayama7\